MYCKLTTQEKLKDLRFARHLTLKEFSEQTSISSSTIIWGCYSILYAIFINH